LVPFMLSKKAMCHSTWALGGALSNSDRVRRCAGAASRDCTALWWIGSFRHERKREAYRRSSLRAVPIIGISESHHIGIARVLRRREVVPRQVPLERDPSSTENRSCNFD
jgi:hypothetical protein